MKLLKRYRKQYMSYAKTAIFSALFLLVAIPFLNIVNKDGITHSKKSSFMVVLNGNEIGYVEEASIAENALLEVRTKLGNDSEGLALVEADMEVIEEKANGKLLTQEEMEDTLYNKLSDKVVDYESQVTAYTVRIDDFTVTVSSLEVVAELFKRVKDRYCSSDNFDIEVVSDDSGAYNVYRVNFELKNENSDDKIRALGFEENIEVIETKKNATDIVNIGDAYELITKEHDEKGTYTIKAGDCLSSIAREHNLTLDELIDLNYGFSVNTPIYQDEVLVVTVPKAEISVKVVEEAQYEEEYSAPVQYVDNNSLYTTTQNVIQAGKPGKRDVVANVTYVNGSEQGREIISESVIEEAVPQIIERGTLTPPTYIKPINSNYITSPFGPRALGTSSFHYGTDWAVPSGTAVKASSSGTVVQAGWKGSYGYCVEIRHSDGSMTRYAHLSAIPVAYGQQVMQGSVIGYSGNTGFSTGPHLHFEIWIGGVARNPVNYVGY